MSVRATRWTTLILDLETVPDGELPPPPARPEKPDALLAPPYHRIVEIGCAWLDGENPIVLRALSTKGDDERAMLQALGRILEERRPRVVTWNGRRFDLPVIVMRSLRHGLSLPWWFNDRNTRYRYSTEGHFDLMDFLSDFGAAVPVSLDTVARLIGLPGKMDVDGSRVAELEADGKRSEITAYCLSDVLQTTAVLLRVELLRGALSIDAYRQQIDGLLALCGKDGRFAALLERIDVRRLQLADPVWPGEERKSA